MTSPDGEQRTESEPQERALRTLLIDDTSELRDLVREVIESDGAFRVVGMAGDGREGVALAIELQPEVVVLDLAMPELDGLAALPLLRKACPHAKVVVLSAFQKAPLSATVLDGGAVGYLEKGGDPYQLRLDMMLAVGLLEQVDDALRTASFDPTSSSVRSARTFVSESLARHDEDADLAGTALLLASELVTNAVMHAAGSPQVVVQVLPATVRIEVHDASTERPVLREPDDDGGRGLRMLDRLASDWGVEARPGGKAVWFTLERQP